MPQRSGAGRRGPGPQQRRQRGAQPFLRIDLGGHRLAERLLDLADVREHQLHCLVEVAGLERADDLRMFGYPSNGGFAIVDRIRRRSFAAPSP
jgi:hypothetical protein